MLFSQAFRSRSPRASLLPVLSRPYPEFLPEEKDRRVIVTVDTDGKRYRCVFLYSVHKRMSLRGKMKKMGSLLRSVSRFMMRTMGTRGLHPRGLSPLFSWRECGTIQQAILAKCDECTSFKVRSHRKWTAEWNANDVKCVFSQGQTYAFLKKWMSRFSLKLGNRELY